jgi:GNAT superfamily N-acetyltransferase
MTQLVFRRATADDLPHIVNLLGDDSLGGAREILADSVSREYVQAFEAVSQDGNQLLAAAEDEGRVVGTLQLSFIPGLSRGGAWRGQIEAVRVASDRRSEGIGEAFLKWAIATCRERGCKLVQLTTDKRRLDAHRFYDRLGFVDSHVGYKLQLP